MSREDSPGTLRRGQGRYSRPSAPKAAVSADSPWAKGRSTGTILLCRYALLRPLCCCVRLLLPRRGCLADWPDPREVAQELWGRQLAPAVPESFSSAQGHQEALSVSAAASSSRDQ